MSRMKWILFDIVGRTSVFSPIGYKKKNYFDIYKSDESGEFRVTNRFQYRLIHQTESSDDRILGHYTPRQYVEDCEIKYNW